MPKILVRDPAWLARATPGYKLFQQDPTSKSQQSQDAHYEGPVRKIAQRGSEVFVAVGNELRWSELGLMKDVGEDFHRERDGRYNIGGQQEAGERVYRVLRTPVSRPITQLSISPDGEYIAILTSHTCHICILPSATLLRPREPAPLRLKTFQLGPTCHVLEQASLISAVWHPLSPAGECLVTVTHDACVRLWELDSDNRSSFDEPALAIDLKKLASATSTQADFRASKYGANKGFSPDDVEMQVASACFGGRGRDDEHGWASMTLWIAMTEGDVYALCPFLPSKWRAAATLLPSLSTSVIEKSRALSDDAEVSESERRAVEQQTKWLAEVDAQDPLLLPGETEFETVELYSRPESISPIPKLQGPFHISPEPDFGEITDVYVIAPKTDDAALFDNDADEGPTSGADGLSISVVCLATSTNEVHICLDLSGVEAEWLPTKRPRGYTLDDDDDDKELLLVESIDLARSEDEDDGWPTFTPSPLDRYELFVTHPLGVCGLSFRPWIHMLEDELSAPSDSGAGFRLNVFLDSANTLVDQPVKILDEENKSTNSAIALLDPIIGFVVLTSAQNVPLATILDDPTRHATRHAYAPDLPNIAGALPAPEPRAPYRPASEFDNPSALPQMIKSASDKRLLGNALKAQVRFSPATLQLMTEAHRIMSTETHRLGIAAADLFRRCERMHAELREQVKKVAEIAQRVDAVTGQDEEEDGGAEDDESERLAGKDRIEQRMDMANQKTAELNERVDALRRKMAKLGGPQLTAKEAAFLDELARLETSVSVSPVGSSDAPLSSSESHSTGPLSSRLDAVQAMKTKLVPQARQAATEEAGQRETDGQSKATEQTGRNTKSGVGSEVRKQKLAQVMVLLERETALVEAVMERLRKLEGKV